MSPLVLLAAASMAAVSTNGVETRCGWIDNPTPANWTLTDRDGEWLIGEQGGYQAPGVDLPYFPKSAWVRTNAGSYGYGCACMRVTTDQTSRRITNILSVAPKSLRQCRADKSLPRR